MNQIVQNDIVEIIPRFSFHEIDELNQKAWDIRRSDLRASWKLANDIERDSINNSYQKGIAESSRTLGYCLWRFGDYPQSLEKSMLALEIFKSLGYKKGDLPVTEKVVNEILSLPISPELKASEQKLIIKTIKSFFKK